MLYHIQIQGDFESDEAAAAYADTLKQEPGCSAVTVARATRMYVVTAFDKDTNEVVTVTVEATDEEAARAMVATDTVIPTNCTSG